MAEQVTIAAAGTAPMRIVRPYWGAFSEAGVRAMFRADLHLEQSRIAYALADEDSWTVEVRSRA